MSDTTTPAPKKMNWLKVALVASLALNLLVGAAIGTHFVRGQAAQRFQGANFVQLVPRKFLGSLPKERRKELVAIMSRYRKEFKGERDMTKQVALKLADAVAADPYEPDRVKAVIGEFMGQSQKLIARGGDAADEIFQKLTPDERKLLADAIRDRVGRVR
jgi:Heavy-metal resistance